MDLYFFNVSLIKHCTLHILNLGLLGVSNGSALQPGINMFINSKARIKVQDSPDRMTGLYKL